MSVCDNPVLIGASIGMIVTRSSMKTDVDSLKLGSANNNDSSVTANRASWTKLLWFVISIVIAWVYVIIPQSGYWTYIFLRGEWFCTVAYICYIEIAEVSIPDASDDTYVLSYVLSFFVSVGVHVVYTYIGAYQNNFYVNTSVSVTAAVLVVSGIYGWDVYQHPIATNAGIENNEIELQDCSGENTLTSQIGQDTCELYDTFVASSRARTESRQLQMDSKCCSNNYTDTTIKEKWTRFITWERKMETALANNPENSKSSRGGASDNEQHNCFISLMLKILPRAYFRKHCRHSRPSMVKGANRIHQWAFASCFNVLFIVYYFFLIWFTQLFISSDNSNAQATELLYLFIIVGTCFRYTLKRLGMLIDRSKIGTASVFFLGEALCLLFYYTFYRVLFERIRSWTLFTLFQVIHLSAEWFLYPFRTSDFYFNTTCRVNQLEKDNNTSYCPRFIYKLLTVCFTTNKLSQKDWQHFISLDFGIRCVVLMLSAIGISILLTTVCIVPYVSSGLRQSQSQLSETIGYIALAIALEVINAYLMNITQFQRQGLQIFTVVLHSLSNERFTFVWVFMAALLLINPFASFEDGNQFKLR